MATPLARICTPRQRGHIIFYVIGTDYKSAPAGGGDVKIPSYPLTIPGMYDLKNPMLNHLKNARLSDEVLANTGHYADYHFFLL